MASTILIAGSGMVARDAGTYFLQQGNSVSWVSRSESCLVDCQAHVNGVMQAFMMQAQVRRRGVRSMSAEFLLYDELGTDPYDVIIECTREEMDDKKDVVARLAVKGHITDATVLATTSQFIAPADIHPACTGFRLGFPLDLSRSMELVFPATMTPSQKEIRRAFCRDNFIRCVG
jgi:3-hydroxyacyl-CoA dehydrogenase